MNHLSIIINLHINEPADYRTTKLLYRKRTLAVTEAYASILHFSFKMLKNSNLICGISFYNHYTKYKLIYSGQSN